MSDKYIPGGSKIEITAPNGDGTQGASAQILPAAFCACGAGQTVSMP